MRELKPCPFCGGEAHIMKMGYPHWVLCKQCGAKVHGGKFGEKEGEAASIEAWNRRTSYSCDHEKDHNADIGKKVCVDTISRQAALKKLAVYIHLIDKTMGKGTLTDDDCMEAAKSVLGEDELPAVQPATNCSEIPNGSDDTISRRAAIDVLDVLWQEHRYRIPGKRETYSQYNEAWQDALDRAEGAIFNLPSVQSEIMRCKDCKYMIDTGDDLMCGNAKGWVVATTSDFGCVLAERRTE